ncbi:prepilin-type N-terminal cleavage/methylation domain-containing protein [Thermostichus sp. MS-CIW-19]
MSAKSRQSLLRAKLAQQILSKAKGFTLIELLVVIVIVGVLSAVAIPQFLNQVRRSRTAEAQAALTEVGRASEVYRLDFGVYPDAYTRIERNDTNGDKYMNDPWRAPNYQTPAASNRSTAPHALRWDTTSTGAPYITRSGSNIQCTIGLGAQETVVPTLNTFVGKSCNVFQ